MIVVKVDKKKGGIERALKNYKYKVIKTKQLNNLREGRYHTKKTTKRRKTIRKSQICGKKKGFRRLNPFLIINLRVVVVTYITKPNRFYFR